MDLKKGTCSIVKYTKLFTGINGDGARKSKKKIQYIFE